MATISVRELKEAAVRYRTESDRAELLAACSVLIWSLFFHSAGQRSLLPQISCIYVKGGITGPKRWTKRSTRCKEIGAEITSSFEAAIDFALNRTNIKARR